MKTKTAQILIGTVSQFNSTRDFGIAIVASDRPRSVSLSMMTGPKCVNADALVPVFTEKRAKGLPSPNDKVVVEVYGVNGSTKVKRWGHFADWQSAETLIAGRKKTHSARSATFMAKFRKAVLTTVFHQPSAMPKSAPRPCSKVIWRNACIA